MSSLIVPLLYPDLKLTRFLLGRLPTSRLVGTNPVVAGQITSGIKAYIRRFSTACKGSTPHCSSKGHREAWIGLSDCPQQLEHYRDRLKDPTYRCNCRAERYVCSCGRYQPA